MTLDIEQYRTAAVMMCERGGLRSDEVMHSSSMRLVPAWEHYALRMAELCLMIEILRECGRYPDKKE